MTEDPLSLVDEPVLRNSVPDLRALPPQPMGVGVLRVQKQRYRDWINAGGTPPIYTTALPPGIALDLSFMTPGTLPPNVTFIRASTATYFDGTVQTATTNTPRWDYNPNTGALNGLLIEEARTNIWLQSADASNAAWLNNGVGVAGPTVTGNQVTAPDGTTTAARVAYPAVSVVGNASTLYQSLTVAAASYSFSVWLRGAVGGEQVYLSVTPNTALWYRQAVTLTTAWQRFTISTPALTAGAWLFFLGTDMRDVSQTATPAQTVYVWGAQVEPGAFPTSYIPTTAAAVTRAIDVCSIQPANMGWFVSPGGSWMAEFICQYYQPVSSYQRVIAALPGGGFGPIITNVGFGVQYDGTVQQTVNTAPVNAAQKIASTYAASLGQVCLNAGPVASGAMSSGYAVIGTNGVAFMCSSGGGTANTIGYIRRLRYWPRVLSASELQQATA